MKRGYRSSCGQAWLKYARASRACACYFQYDEIIVTGAVLALALSAFAVRKWRELEVEIDERLVVVSALKESEGRYRTLAEAAQDFIFIVGRDDRIQYINTPAAGKLSRQVNKIVGKERHKVFPKSMAKQQDIMLERVFNEGVPLNLDNMAVFSGMETWQSTSLVPIYGEDDEVKAVLAIARDITERKLAETELQRAKDSLEVAVAKRTRELQELNERLQLELDEKKLAEERLHAVNRAFRTATAANHALVVSTTGEPGLLRDICKFTWDDGGWGGDPIAKPFAWVRLMLSKIFLLTFNRFLA